MSRRDDPKPTAQPVTAPAVTSAAQPAKLSYEEVYARAVGLRDQRLFPAHRILDLFTKGAKDYSGEELNAIAQELDACEVPNE
jgi:hypothetical protein